MVDNPLTATTPECDSQPWNFRAHTLTSGWNAEFFITPINEFDFVRPRCGSGTKSLAVLRLNCRHRGLATSDALRVP
jgi:hypothetical protein